MATIGAKIREARREAGYSNAESLAVEMGVGIRTVQRWESDETTPSIAQLLRIGKLVDKSLVYFIPGEEEVVA